MIEEELSYRRAGDWIRGYACRMPTENSLPAVLLIHDVRGLYEHFRDITSRFAREGFFAFALDLYSREGTPDLPDMEAVFRWMEQLPDERVLADLQGAVDFLGTLPAVESARIGITGFCMGGQYALMAACTVTGLAACVSFYGMLRYTKVTDLKPQSPLDLVPSLTCPYLGLFGEEDAIIPGEDVRKLEGLLRRHNKEYRIKMYPGAGHAFFNDTRPDAYRPEVARDAWQRALTFFHTHLRR